MSETSPISYDMDKIADAMDFAKKTNNYLLETLIQSFITEKDPDYRYDKYQAIVNGVARAKKIWKF